DARGYAYGSHRRHRLPACSLRGERTNSRRECRRDEGRPHPTKGRTRQGPCRPESETPGEDQPARLQDRVSTTERKRQTQCIATEGTCKRSGAQRQSIGGNSNRHV